MTPGKVLQLRLCALLYAAWAVVYPCLGWAQTPGTAQPGTSVQRLATPLGAALNYQGLPVASIEVRGVQEDPTVMSHLLALIRQEQNQPLDRHKVSESIRALYATGRFADISVEAERTQQNQVTLVFVGTPNFFIGGVNVDGAPRKPTANQLVDATRLELGTLYTKAKVEHAITQMKVVLTEEGFYLPDISYEEEPHPEIQQMGIHFRINPGPQARFGALIVEGDSGLTQQEALSITRFREAELISSDRLNKALDRLRRHYAKQRRLEAKVTLVDRRYHPDTNRLNYVLHLERGPVVEIWAEGVKISRGKLKKLVPVYEEHAADEDLLNEGRRNIRDYLQTQGYFDASVNFVERPRDNGQTVDIIYQVELGPKHHLTNIYLSGNKYFDTGLIRERMQVQPVTWLLSSGRYSQELLTRDVDNIRGLYLNNGFEQVQVKSEVRDDYQGQVGRMAVFIDIVEGPQTKVETLIIRGNETVKESTLRPLLTTSEGQPFAESNLATDRELVLNYYYNQGFPAVRFEVDWKADPANQNSVVVTYTITEDQRIFVDRVLMSGLQHTKQGVAQRQLHIHDQEPLSQSGMLTTQQKLYDLGVFNEVQMGVQNPDGDTTHKNLLYHFQEARRWTVDYGFGIEIQSGTLGSHAQPNGAPTVSPRGTLGLTRLNVGGRAHTLVLQGNLGRLEQRGLISYEAPRFLEKQNLRLTLTAYYDNSLDINTFTSQRLEGSVQLEHTISKATDLLYRFTYRRVRATNLVVDPSQIPLLSAPVRVGIPSISYIHDHRDDPIESKHGSYTTVDGGVASSVFGSEADFGRAVVQNATYHPFLKQRFVFARNTRIGIAEPFGDTTLLPLPERFFAGGGNSLRGYEINQAGPRDLTTGQPLGGNALIVNNFELRLPPMKLPYAGDSVSLVLFQDAGNVFATTTDMFHNLTRFQQKNRDLCLQQSTSSQCDFSYISLNVGGGVRYKTPIGPLRFDLGYNLNPPAFPVYTTTNNVTTFRGDTLRHFNFYFSIGQTF